jgi:hypothetical protein
MAVDAALQQIDERGDMASKPDAPASLLEVLTTDSAEIRIVTNQIGQFPALLDQIAPRESFNLLVKTEAPIGSLSTVPESLKLNV